VVNYAVQDGSEASLVHNDVRMLVSPRRPYTYWIIPPLRLLRSLLAL